MVRQFKKTVDHNNKTGWDRKTCNFYEEFSQILLEKPNIVPKLTISSSGLMNRKRPIEEISGEEGDENVNDEQEQEEQEEQQPSTIKLTKW